MTEQEKFMGEALALAREAAAHGEVPVGCVVVRDGAVVGRGRNRREEKQAVSSHAEMEAMAQANEMLRSWRLDDCDLYVTLEPCPMCAGAILNARVRRVFYGARDEAMGACGGVLNLFMEDFPHHPQLVGGILKDECAAVLSEFFRDLRKDPAADGETESYDGVRLETRDLVLKKARFEDWKALYDNIWQSEDTARHMLWDVTKTPEEAMARMERTIAFQKKEKYALDVYLKETGQAIGWACMHELEPGVYEEMGVALGPAFVGRGYGKQILNALTEEARRMGAREFQASNRQDNDASRAVQMACGFTFDHLSEEKTDPRNGLVYRLEINKKQL